MNDDTYYTCGVSEWRREPCTCAHPQSEGGCTAGVWVEIKRERKPWR